MGMPHDKIPQMLGVVLSSTKYGVKQTRGKFGLGAKMALVWSKKSTGFPIEVWSATSPNKPISYCKLDIDIYKNQPRIIKHEQRPNTDNWRGTEITVIIGGKWTSYRAKVVNYLRQLAVITPYAQLRMNYTDPASEKYVHIHIRNTNHTLLVLKASFTIRLFASWFRDSWLTPSFC
jgi:DNA topoisomerase-6 subunit B